MTKNFSKAEVIDFGRRLAEAGLICKYPPRSHSHNINALFPQTAAQYDWLRRDCGSTYNLCLCHSIEEVLAVCPELEGQVKATKSGRFCRILIRL